MRSATSIKSNSSQSLKRQLLMLLGGTWLIALFLIIAGIFLFTFRVEEETWKTRQDEAARNTALTVAKSVQRVDDLLFATGLLGVDEVALEQSTLKTLLAYNPTLLELLIIAETGQPIAGAYQTADVLANLNTIPQSRWYQVARAGGHFISSLQFSARDEPYLIMALPASDNHVIAARVSMDVIRQAVTDVRFGATGRAYIVDATGRIIAHTNPEIVLTQTYINDRPEFLSLEHTLDQRWLGSYTNFENHSVVGATAPVPDTDWVVFVELTQDEAYADSRTALIGLGGSVLILGIILQFFMAGRLQHLIFKPLQQLRGGVEQFGEDNLEYRLKFTRRDELGELAHSFDLMAERLQAREKQINLQAQLLRAEIDKRQLAEAEAVAQRDFAVQVMNSMGQGLAVLDTDLKFTYVNPSGAALVGYQPQELMGKPSFELVPIEDQTELLALAPRWQAGETTIYETKLRTANGGLVDVLASVTPRQKDGVFMGIISVITDLTERKRSEQALRISEERYRHLAVELQKLNSDLEDRVQKRTAELQQALNKAREAIRLKQEFLANTSHELRTPLSGIMGALSLVLEDTCDTPAEEREMIRIAYQASRNLLTIVTDILDTAKMEAGQWVVHVEPLPAMLLVNEVYRLSQPQAEAKSLTLRMELQTEPEPMILADPEGLRRILLNLVTNAIKFTEQGSVTLAVSRSADQAIIKVIDTGIGIKPEQLPRLFQPFVQADGSTTRKFGGSGLGLSISRLLAEAMGGKIEMDSEGVGQGSTITLTLPIATPELSVEFMTPRN